MGGGGSEVVDLLSLLAFLPSVISPFLPKTAGGPGPHAPSLDMPLVTA